MSETNMTQQLLAAKADKGLTFSQLGETIGRSEVWIASLIYGQASASQDEADVLVKTLGLDSSAGAYLTEYSVKGLGNIVPADPLVYRFYEIMQVYGLPLKDVIQEKFGDGIMSAIDFTLAVDKEENPAGDRVVLTMNGKFLPYKKW
jgi:cyanate lyase